jgi:hypothetical protein
MHVTRLFCPPLNSHKGRRGRRLDPLIPPAPFSHKGRRGSRDGYDRYGHFDDACNPMQFIIAPARNVDAARWRAQMRHDRIAS